MDGNLKFCLRNAGRGALRIYRSAVICVLLATAFLSGGPLVAAERDAGRQTHPAGRELTDELGRKVQVPQEASRIVSLAPNLTEIVFALGDGDRLAGDTDFCDYPPEASRKLHVGGVVNPNLEQIVALMPDLILATTSINRRQTVDALDRMGLPVYVTNPRSIEEMVRSVEHLGVALGTEKSAATLAGELRSRLSDLDRRLATIPPRRALLVVWTDPLTSVGGDTFPADALRRAGGRSVVDTGGEWPHVSLEEIVRLQPEFLVFAGAHGGDTQRKIAGLRTRPGWRDLEAVRRGETVVVSESILRPAPRIVDAVEQLARVFHPEVFTARDVTPAEGVLAFHEMAACPSALRINASELSVNPSKLRINNCSPRPEACACAR
jgi:iron complex transport system substrate-binding protein